MTIRYFALLAICIAIALLSIPRPQDAVLVNTGNELDIAIAGHGNFHILDKEAAEVRYTRTGKLSIDANGQLAATINGTQWLIDPPIQIPNDWERIVVLPDGLVQTLAAGHWTDVGQLQLAVFTATPTFDDPLSANLYHKAAGTLTLKSPGKGAGVIQQGWIEQRPSVINELAIRVLLAILAAGVLRRVTLGGNNERQDYSITQDRQGG